MSHPAALQDIVDLFEHLPEVEKRENLIAYADNAPLHEPRAGEEYSLVDERKDEDCTDKVGVYVMMDGNRRAHFRVKLGPHVQTLTKAMSAILCRGLDGCTPEEVMEIEQDFVPKIVGGQLVRVRSQTVYYILTRIKSACRVLLNRERARGVEAN
ncbi:MAG TPA: SufE family protein [Opitutaceae bacterium]